jgi:vacuolar-type H+-ATPase subunit F/Vma7
MSRAAIIGEALRVQGYAMAGAAVYPAEDRDEARAAWEALPADTAVVVLTARAAADLSQETGQRRDVLTVVLS